MTPEEIIELWLHRNAWRDQESPTKLALDLVRALDERGFGIMKRAEQSAAENSMMDIRLKSASIARKRAAENEAWLNASLERLAKVWNSGLPPPPNPQGDEG